MKSKTLERKKHKLVSMSRKHTQGIRKVMRWMTSRLGHWESAWGGGKVGLNLGFPQKACDPLSFLPILLKSQFSDDENFFFFFLLQ